MRNVLHFVAVAEPDDALEVVLYYSEMIAMVVDVRRQEQRVAASDDALLAQVRSAPVDFQPELCARNVRYPCAFAL